MVVMHDPSGCNSTYNTHDETRWYDTDSRIFITGFTERDAIFGNDKKVIRDVYEAAERLCPAFIALCGSPIPYLNGTDFAYLAREIERASGICTFFIDTNGTHSYVRGASAALLAYAQHVLKPHWDLLAGKKPIHSMTTINLLGATPLDFFSYKAIAKIQEVLYRGGICVQSVFSMLGDAPVDTLQTAIHADCNLVLSSVGIPLAEWMYECYGIPYVYGVPIKGFTKELCNRINRAVIAEFTPTGHKDFLAADDADIAILGEAIFSASIASACKKPCVIKIPLGGLPLKGGQAPLKKYKLIVADPLYQPIVPDAAKLIPLPHMAFSGRCFVRQWDELVEKGGLFSWD